MLAQFGSERAREAGEGGLDRSEPRIVLVVAPVLVLDLAGFDCDYDDDDEDDALRVCRRFAPSPTVPSSLLPTD